MHYHSPFSAICCTPKLPDFELNNTGVDILKPAPTLSDLECVFVSLIFGTSVTQDVTINVQH